MKKLFMLLIPMAMGMAHAQDKGIGLRIGDPTGITFKKYLPGHKAVELNAGTSTIGWHARYYRHTFLHLERFAPYEYRDHHVISTAYLQGKYLLRYDIPIEGLIGALGWYWGGGATLKVAKIEYRYSDSSAEVWRGLHTDVDVGPEGVLGMEYIFEDIPLAIFGDISLMIEVMDRPGVPKGFSAVGARYNF